MSDGTVQDRSATPGASHYQWTRKVKAKTVSVALSREQYEWLKAAIENWRRVQSTLKEMHRLSREELFETVPEPNRRKRLSEKALGVK
jgi:hypothetical protein